MQTLNYAKTRHTCYFTNLSTASTFSLPPMLFLTFREMYGLSYSLLGSLVLINFCTQLMIDLIFSFFSKHFNIKLTIRTLPMLTALGLIVYAAIPAIFPQHAYLGLVAGTVIFSISAGLCEVLLSPLIAAIPSETPERDMSMLHSLYAYGVLMVVVVSSVYFKLFGRENWLYLTLFWAILPIITSVLYHFTPIPEMDMSHGEKSSGNPLKNFGFVLCVLCIFFGSSAENAMTNWISGYIENVFKISKAVGDILGMALFAVLLGLTRSWYAKYGKNIYNMLFFGMAGAAVCYLIAALCPSPIISMAACVATGICTAMLWPGTLIFMENKYPALGVTAYALMASGGDLGASIAPQLFGVVTDTVAASDFGIALASSLAISPEQLGMKAGMLVAAGFPIIGVAVLIIMKKYFRKQN